MRRSSPGPRYVQAPRRRPGLARAFRLFGIAVLAGAAAGGVGTGFASLTRESKPSAESLVDLEILAAVLHPAASPRGRLRKRARQSVELEVINHGSAPLTLERPMLTSGGRSARADVNARREAHGLLGPLEPSATVRGVLRFETAGALTDSLFDTRRVTLRIGGRDFALRVTIGDPAA